MYSRKLEERIDYVTKGLTMDILMTLTIATALIRKREVMKSFKSRTVMEIFVDVLDCCIIVILFLQCF